MKRNEYEAHQALSDELARHPGWTTDPSRNRAYNDDFGTDPWMGLKVAGICAAWIVVAVIVGLS